MGKAGHKYIEVSRDPMECGVDLLQSLARHLRAKIDPGGEISLLGLEESEETIFLMLENPKHVTEAVNIMQRRSIPHTVRDEPVRDRPSTGALPEIGVIFIRVGLTTFTQPQAAEFINMAAHDRAMVDGTGQCVLRAGMRRDSDGQTYWVFFNVHAVGQQFAALLKAQGIPYGVRPSLPGGERPPIHLVMGSATPQAPAQPPVQAQPEPEAAAGPSKKSRFGGLAARARRGATTAGDGLDGAASRLDGATERLQKSAGKRRGMFGTRKPDSKPES